jgi:enoyl-CoA hydratase
MSDEILFNITGGVAVLRFNRPQARNALNWAAQEQFASHIQDLAQRPDVRALILTGSDGVFVAGGDLKELAQGDLAANGQRLNRLMSGALAQMAQLPLPVLAAINGPAVGGGCEITLACDLRLASAAARLDFAQIRLGLTTGWGGAARLVRLLGASRATDILLRGRTLSAHEAYAIDLLHAIVPGDQSVLDLAQSWANDLAALPAEALAAMKQLLATSAMLDEQSAAQLERRLFNQLWGRPAHRQALAAFLAQGRAADLAGDAHATEGDAGR